MLCSRSVLRPYTNTIDGSSIPGKRCREEEEASGHPRDARIRFEPEGHVYYVDGERVPISVTGLWGQYFPRFDAEATIDRCFDAWKAQPYSKYHLLLRYLDLVEGRDEAAQKAAVAAMWEAHGTKAASEGTRMHAQIEGVLNGKACEDASPEMAQFEAWRAEWASGLTVWRTEWAVFDEAAKVAGMIDSVWKDEEGRLVIVDWKRCKPASGKRGLSAADKAYGGQTGFGPCADLPDTSFSHYCVQLNLYKRILERGYGVEVHAMHLAQFHPHLKAYHCVEVPAMVEMVDEILSDRERMLSHV